MLGVGKALGQSSGAVWRGCSVLFLPLVPQSPAELSSLHTPPSFLGACASPYVNPGEYKLGGPHPGGSHHQPVAWAPLQKSNLTERAEMQQQLRERTDRSLFPPNHCYLL